MSYLNIDNIYCGIAEELIKKIKPESVAVSVWSPPYHVGKNYEADQSYEEWLTMLSNVIKLHFTVLKPGGFLAINITLSALFDLCLDSFLVRKVLVIAPLRVARDTWPAEIKKWDHLKGLTYSVAVGTEKERTEAMMKRSTLYVINRENVDWLVNKSGIPFDFDMVVIDELSSFKSYSAKRFKSLLKIRPGVRRIVGLTGTPSTNGLMDLWAEFRILDLGQRLGRYISHYRNTYFKPDKRNAQIIYSYKPLDGAEDAIYQQISDITISMKSVDYLDMPECVMNEVPVTLDETEWRIYADLKEEMVANVGDEEIDAVNAAVLSGKLLQMANGAVYDSENKAHVIHDKKLDALED